MQNVRLALCQLNYTVGDIAGNVKKIKEALNEASGYQADIVVFSELAVTGYPPEDLLFDKAFVSQAEDAVNDIASEVKNYICILGCVRDVQGQLYNSAAIIYNSKVVDFYDKIHLPNYGVFDEKRYFLTGSQAKVYALGNICFAVTICEDIWYSHPALHMANSGASLIICINASPYHQGKLKERQAVISQRAKETSASIVYLNLVGGQDEVVFDGLSFVMDSQCNIIATAKAFEEDLLIVDLTLTNTKPCANAHCNFSLDGACKSKLPQRPVCEPPMPIEQEIYLALVTGTRDYVRKNRFTSVCLGLSGGVDSSLVADIAVSAFGAKNVTGLIMPSMFTSQSSIDDALALASNLGIRTEIIPINEIFEGFLSALKPFFANLPSDITEENLQARIRGCLLMAFANKFKMLVLTTGNKSEMSVGYATLYGDMAGAFAVIKDIPKTMVYRICRWRNETTGSEIIPESVLRKPPTAELRPNQKDTDSLPPYEILDGILYGYIEQRLSLNELVAQGYDAGLVRQVMRLVDYSEYKRRQSPPGVKITKLAFGKDRRMPITNKFAHT